MLFQHDLRLLDRVSHAMRFQLTVRTVARTLQLCAQTGIFLKAWLGLGLVLGIVKSTIFTCKNPVNRKNQP